MAVCGMHTKTNYAGADKKNDGFASQWDNKLNTDNCKCLTPSQQKKKWFTSNPLSPTSQHHQHKL